MGWVSIGLGLGSLALNALKAKQQRKAFNRQQAGLDKAEAITREMFDLARADEQPFREFGVNSLETAQGLLDDPDSFLNSKLIQSILDKRQKQLEKSAAVKGNLFSGGTLESIANDASSFALPAYQNQVNTAINAATVGRPNPNIPINMGNTLSRFAIQSGNIQANKKMVGVNAFENTLQDAAKIAGFKK